MPATKLEGQELLALVRFAHSITVRPVGAGRGAPPLPRVTVETATGKLEGVKLGEGFDDLQMRTVDGKVHLLRKADGKYREVTSEVDWPEYNGDPRGNRYTAISQITKENVATWRRAGSSRSRRYGARVARRQRRPIIYR